MPTSFDDLWKQQYVYDANTPYDGVGTEVPTSKDRKHWGGKYPFLYDRLANNPYITGAECDKFLRDYNFDRLTFSENLKSNSNGDVLGLLNDFYSIGLFSTTAVGLFCCIS